MASRSNPCNVLSCSSRGIQAVRRSKIKQEFTPVSERQLGELFDPCFIDLVAMQRLTKVSALVARFTSSHGSQAPRLYLDLREHYADGVDHRLIFILIKVENRLCFDGPFGEGKWRDRS